MERRPQSHKLIPVALLLLLAISWGPLAECAVLPTCPMMTMDRAEMDGCHPTGPAASQGEDSLELTRIPCCGVSNQAVPEITIEVSIPSSTPLSSVTATPATASVSAAPAQRSLDRTPPPKVFGRDLLSHHQAFLL